ncbi:phosphoribosyltransferase domain-containing protein [Curtobacterium sp. 9128]|uniref:phosphoribosyltransferase domain-containing protein n=1 Tax=Curtobacterium sp. 9128 TaxID=1793722 RepID=UPI0011AAD914|nr:phosphoribosyltransferase domain-containing protein [Curtobacterium sp. 9128]
MSRLPTPTDLGIELEDGERHAGRTQDPLAVPLADLVRLALRRNPKRAHLLVSTVLAKHVPTVPAVALLAGEALGARVADALDDGHRFDAPTAARLRDVLGAQTSMRRAEDARDAQDHDGLDRATALSRAADALRTDLAARRTDHPDTLVLGFAETATALGAAVAEALGADHLHSTRLDPPGAVAATGFDEAHSHATTHRLLPADPAWLPTDGTVVLVDDELSTGATARATIRALHALAPQRRWVVASLVDLRSAADVAATDALAAELGATVTVLALARGGVHLPDDLVTTAAALVDAHAALGPVHADVPPVAAEFLPAPPTAVDRFGVPAAAVRRPRTDVEGIAADLARVLGPLDPTDRVLVLGTEEHMHTPLVIAAALRAASGADVRSSTTTRSPVAVFADPAWPIRSGVAHRSHDRTVDGPGPRYAYNVHGFDAVVLVPEPGTERSALAGPDGLLPALGRVAPRVVVVESPLRAVSDEPVPTPLTGPSFGSYEPDEVTWLLQDLAGAPLEADTASRERAVQLEGANYAESLPVEYTPSEEYEALYRSALDRSAARIAEAVGIVTELVLRGRRRPVLVSLARAGTPVGVLMRRWARERHGTVLPHLTASIVRGVGIDETALRWLAAHHDPEDVVFVDGWTGKGAITRELTAALDRFAESDGIRFRDDLAVLADPAGCTPLHGTREDFLVPSACLNSTVSGLVSRTVYNRRWTPEGTFHGAKQYRELGARDRSRPYVDAVAARFAEVADRVEAAVAADSASTRAPDWRGMRTVQEVGATYGIDDLHLVKPGIGETTRVLLRRVPWQVLVRDPDDPDVAHVVALATERGVPVVHEPDLAYRCVGLIHPLGSRVVEATA